MQWWFLKCGERWTEVASIYINEIALTFLEFND